MDPELLSDSVTLDPSDDSDEEPPTEIVHGLDYCLLGTKHLILTPDDVVEGDKYFSPLYRSRLDSMRSHGTFSLSRLLVSVIKELVRSKGRFYRVAVPIQFIQPFSALELFSLTLRPTRSFLGLLSSEFGGLDPASQVRRMVALVEWFLVNNLQNYFEGFLHVKPFNPVLGEVFACWWEEEDGEDEVMFHEGTDPVCHLLAEQVSHHPPVSCFHFVSEDSDSGKKITIEATIRPKQKMYYNSGSLSTTGSFIVRLRLGEDEAAHEVYSLHFPENLASGLFYGKKRVGTYGEAIVECERTHLRARLFFKENASLEGSIERSGEKLCSIESEDATSEVFLLWSGGRRELLVDVGLAAANRRYVQRLRPVRYQGEHESRRRWLKVSKYVFKGKDERAADAKIHVEDAMRREREERKRLNVEWAPRYFEGDLGANQMHCKLTDDEVRRTVITRIVDPMWERALHQFLKKRVEAEEEENEPE